MNLYVVATPIGNLEDITIRAIKTLFEVEYIFAENVTKTGNLLSYLSKTYPDLVLKKPQIISFNEFEEQIKTPEALNFLSKGNAALASEAGTPLLSDPGYRLVSEALKHGFKVIPIPGPSALTAAMSVAGLPTDKFLFFGFLPKSKEKKRKNLEEMNSKIDKSFTPTIIIYESPHRILETLKVIEEVFGDIEMVIARELTKIYEEVNKKTISDFIKQYTKNKAKGEFVLLFNLKSKASSI